jgi:hypothetical protein
VKNVCGVARVKGGLSCKMVGVKIAVVSSIVSHQPVQHLRGA